MLPATTPGSVAEFNGGSEVAGADVVLGNIEAAGSAPSVTKSSACIASITTIPCSLSHSRSTIETPGLARATLRQSSGPVNE